MSQISATGASNTLTAFFDSRDDAEDAVEKLLETGIPQANVRLVPGYERDADGTAPAEPEHKGFFNALADFFMPDEDRYSYAEGLRRGGYLVTVSGLSTSQHDAAIDILDREGAIDFDAREEEWRSSGWAGYQAGTEHSTGPSDTYSTTAGLERTFGTTGSRDHTLEDDEVIPVVEEQLQVGKRDVNRGRVRVRSYVVEEPVNETVNLSSERVVLERRPVDRPLSAGDIAFQDREIEAEEHVEEAVVAKTARVTEEIALRKETEQRSETVSDTVRRTEVEVEDDRTVIDKERLRRQ